MTTSKPKLLLHVCCAPCGVAIFNELLREFYVSVYYSNSNIYPREEYLKRRDEAEKVCSKIGVSFIEDPYDPDSWFSWAKKFASEPEGGKRCSICFEKRLQRTASYATENDFEYFASTLTSGRNKKADVINPIGRALAEQYRVEFIEEDWKKKGRQEKARQITKQSEIYRQHYCGCNYSQSI